MKSLYLLLISALMVNAASLEKRETSEADAAVNVDANIQQLTSLTLNNRVVWDRLNEMTSKFGSRLTGSKGLADSTKWIVDQMKADGLSPTLEGVKVKHWTRGREYLVHVNVEGAPKGQRDIKLTTLGRSAATSPNGIVADIVVVRNFAELSKLGQQRIRGKIVLFVEPWQGYGATAIYRMMGAQEAAKYGAVAVIIASVTPESSSDTLHTGLTLPASIPIAAITRSDARNFETLYNRAIKDPAKYKVPRLFFYTESHLDPKEYDGYNIVVDVKGRESPEKIVLLGGHIDSWDIGVGAVDDGAGAFTSWEALRAIARLPQRPKRTVRLVLWVDEEQGNAGGNGYAAAHAKELNNHVMALETDLGNFEPAGIIFSGSNNAANILKSIGEKYQKPKVGQFAGDVDVVSGDTGADIAPLCNAGVPCAGLLSRDPITGEAPGINYGYFNVHHSHGDQMSFLKPEQLAKNAAALAIWTYAVAEQAVDLPRS
ncbi:hypothetical protein BDF19DRAFT_498998 [Syncephalis fuscata]|nr:hypothetical protein BDF19DRAFT_498998 [Syncephalis fuscata]